MHPTPRPRSDRPRTECNAGYVYRDRVGGSDAGTTVLAYHVARWPHSDAAAWRQAIESGRVRVNGATAQAGCVLRAGDELEFHRPPWEEPDAPMRFDVVHEDEHVLAVDKPSGLQVLPAGPFLERTLWSLVRASAHDRADAAPVHRLGRGTSGIVLFGKTPLARAALSLQFRACTPTKTYFAVVQGCDLPDSLVARARIGRVAHGPMHIWVADERGKPSTTRVRVLRRDRARDVTLVAAQPITGRPDQIRIHLAAAGAPIVGDPLFGIGGRPISDARPGEGGYLLHAAALSFLHPVEGRTTKLRSRAPWRFDDRIDDLVATLDPQVG